MARTDTLGHYLTDVADAIRAKGGTSATITASDFDTAIANLPSGGTTVEKNDVTYFDYDGTILYSYTKAQFLQLSAHPASPTYDDLTFEKWNWTLSDAKTYVTSYGKLNIGAQCYTTDGKDHIHISVPENNYSFMLFLHAAGVDSDDTIDWGDGSPIEEAHPNGAQLDNTHTYALAGDYVIKIDNKNHHLHFQNLGSNLKASFFRNGTSNASNSLNSEPTRIVTKIAFSQYYTYYNSSGLFASLPNLRAIAFSTNSGQQFRYGSYNFRHCMSLKYVTVPEGIASISSNTFFYSGIEHVSLPYVCSQVYGSSFYRTPLKEIYLPPATSTATNSFAECYDLKEAVCPINGTFTNGILAYNPSMENVYLYNVTGFAFSAINDSYNITRIKFPSTVTTIQGNASSLFSLKELDFSDHTSVPTLSNSTALNNINSNFRIIVPDDLYSTWITSGNWGGYSSHIVKASEA